MLVLVSCLDNLEARVPRATPHAGYSPPNAPNSHPARGLFVTGIGPPIARTSATVAAPTARAERQCRPITPPARAPLVNARSSSTATSAESFAPCMPATRRMAPRAVMGTRVSHIKNPKAKSLETVALSRRRRSSCNAQPMASPPTTPNGTPPTRLVQIGTMMTAWRQPNAATPTRPTSAPAISDPLNSGETCSCS